jgi:preprotein translocase subunit YajC
VESLFLLVMAGLLFLLLVSRSRRQRREIAQVQSVLAVGARIMTTAGLHATIVSVDDETVVLETGPGQTSRWDRRAVARVLPETAVGSGPDPLVRDEPSIDLTTPRPSEQPSSRPDAPDDRA